MCDGTHLQIFDYVVLRGRRRYDMPYMNHKSTTHRRSDMYWLVFLVDLMALLKQIGTCIHTTGYGTHVGWERVRENDGLPLHRFVALSSLFGGC